MSSDARSTAESEEGFTAIDRRRLADHAVDQIERLIISGRLAPGQKLPSERDLGVKLGVSRPTLREAIRALTLMGILEPRQGDGTYVRDVDAALLLRPAKVLLSRKGGLAWLFEVRRLLEGGAAALAAARATPGELEEVREWLAGYPTGEMDPSQVRERDVQFHSLIIEAAHNPLLSTIVASLISALLESRLVTGRDPEWEFVGQADLKAVAHAILRRDPTAAQLAMARHLDYGATRPSVLG